jgi:hypothetical protein
MKNLSHAHYWVGTTPISIILKEITSPISPIDLFSNKFPSKHAKVSHSSIFPSSVAREGVPFSLSLTATQKALVFQVCQKGVSTETISGKPIWIFH